MRNSKTLEFMNNLNEKINKDNIEINKAIANPNLGKNQDRIKQAGYNIEYDGDYIKNPKTGKGVWPKDYSRDEKKKVDFKGKLDSKRETMHKTNRYKFDQEENRIPKSAKIGKRGGHPVFNSDEVEAYSPNYRDAGKKSISTNVNTYKRAIADRNEKTKNAAYYDKEVKRDEDKIKEIEKDKERHQGYADNARKEADWAENKRKELMSKVREKKTSTVKEGAEPIAKRLKKKLKESENKKESKLTETRQEEILSKLPKKKINESYEVWQKYYEDGSITTEYVQSFDNYEKAQKFADGLNQDPDCEAWVKDLEESEEVYQESEQEQQLNEETVGEKITAPSGKFWVGDPCYVLSDDVYYGIWDDKYHFEDGKIDVDDKLSFLVHGTAYGDGSYPSSNGFDYGVDSGTLAVIPMDLVAKLDGVQFGTVETSNTAWLDYNDGTFDITLDNKSFSIETGDFEDDSDEWNNYEDEEEIEDYYDQENDD